MKDIKSVVSEKLQKIVSQKGKGGEPEGRGGESWCVCPKCGLMVEHKREGQGKSKPCVMYRCPECGTPMMGESEFDRLKEKPKKRKK